MLIYPVVWFYILLFYVMLIDVSVRFVIPNCIIISRDIVILRFMLCYVL